MGTYCNRLTGTLAASILFSLAWLGCNISLPDGALACTSDRDCPDSWSCLEVNDRHRCFRVPVVPADGCALDNGGCGDPTRWTCSQEPNGITRCTDVDECAQDNGDCGDAALWTCINNLGEPATCKALDACAENNGGCGDPSGWLCSSSPGAGAMCSEISACAIDNGGCGDPRYTRCALDDGAVVCRDIDECAKENGGCGDPVYSRCENKAQAPATCQDIDECAQNNGGCGDPNAWRCQNNAGAAPGCMLLDACLDDEVCGDTAHWKCVKQPTSNLPKCEDVDECADANGGCGDPTRTRCINNLGAAPSCSDIDECASLNGGCGDASVHLCTNRIAAPPTCSCLWNAPFAEAVPVPGLNDSDMGVLEVSVRLDADELNAIFVSNRPDNAGLPRNQNLWIASRTSRAQAFGTPVLLPGGNQTGGYTYSFSMTDDWRTILIQADPDLSKGSELFMASRAKADDPFGPPTLVNALGRVESPWLQPDGTLYFDRAERPFRARREGNTFAEAEPWTDLGTGETAFSFVMSRDDRTIYFGSRRGENGGDSDIWVAHREEVSLPFAPAVSVSTVNSDQEDQPNWISADGCRLYFHRYQAGRADLFVAER